LSVATDRKASGAALIQAIVAGRYIDRYRRGSDGWQFADRLFIVDLPGGQTRHFA